MCEQCERIDAEIAYYKQRLVDLYDKTAIALVKLAIENLESDKAGLHTPPQE
jgi:hypothetical protein